jgi:hypothetical protein
MGMWKLNALTNNVADWGEECLPMNPNNSRLNS